MSVQQQEGSCDCGLFSIAMAMEVCCRNNPECAIFHQEVMCNHLIDCFEEESCLCSQRNCTTSRNVYLDLQNIITSLTYIVTVKCLKTMMR